jgi:hypothetical protein
MSLSCDTGATWGSTPAERAAPFPCDRHLPGADQACFRAVDVDAPASVAFRWLCQLREAPYSYDVIDNLGRRSPRELTPGLDQPAVGQRFMTIFKLVEFEPDRHLTLVLDRASRAFGDIAVTYLVEPKGPSRSRFVVKLAIRHRGTGPAQALRSALLPWLDLVMMRKQLLTLRDLAEA